MRVAVWLLFSAYLASLVYRYAGEVLFYGEVIQITGRRAVQLLIASLLLGPLVRLFSKSGWPKKLLPFRRDIGLMVFGFSALHLGVYLLRHDGERIWREALSAEMATGWVAMVVFSALAITSNNRSQRRLRSNWKRLHRFVYVAAILLFAHWWLTAFDPTTAYVYATLTAIVLLVVPTGKLLTRRPR